jgi:methylenetetrahydrofolate dehydrogenase (NADP+)/methenyltetrahydrofolate cyclohydrolase
MILDGKKVSEKRLELLRERIDESGLHPVLATVIAGNDPASRTYVSMKQRACERVHIGTVGIELPDVVTTGQLLECLRGLNADPLVSGILVQLPLPGQVNTTDVLSGISPVKDVDGFHPENLGSLLSGSPRFVPATPKGIMSLLSEYAIDPAGTRAVVVGRSLEVGRPMAALLLNADATVTVCHRMTQDVAAETKRAELLVVAVGKAGFITREMVRKGATVVDVGTNRVNGRLCGDVAFDEVEPVAGAITPVPGGVGPMTIASLLENTYQAEKLRACTVP